ncbi:MAG TPA: DUF4097 family beta strand repeat-containing protein [Blastocatellia bacterium]|nr:DUF4097 family beta strand repeat-containing protein [Blastocatellia bacterium]
MADTCINCGSELFYGQRFCRSCGNITDSSSREEAPTQRMTPPPDVRGSDLRGSDMWGARGAANTAPTPKSETNPVYAPPSYYQPTVPPLPMQPMPPYTPPRSRSWIPILVLLIILIFGGGTVILKRIIGNIKGNITSRADIEVKKSFPLNKGAALSIATENGSVSVEGWNRSQAEVRIITRGKSNGQDVMSTIKSDNDNFSLDTRTVSNSENVSVVIKVPDTLGTIKLSSENGTINVSHLTGSITIEAENGVVKLDDVSGVESVKTENGIIKAQMNSIAKDRPVTFETENGKIELVFGEDFNANLEASTERGFLNADDELGLQIQSTRPLGKRASGRIGKGGAPLTIKTENGGISLSR